MVDFRKQKNDLSYNNIVDSSVTQINAETIENVHIHEQLLPISSPSIIQEVLEGIIELSIYELEASELDTQHYTVENKIDCNNIVVYKKAYDIYMIERQLIEHRLKALEIGKNPLASEKLYRYVQRIYGKHCRYECPDTIIECVCNEIKVDLLRVENISLDEVAVIPYIVFYVFSKCYIFKKPI